MNILDPKQVQGAVLRHRQFIAKPRSPLSLELIYSHLQAQIEKLKTITSNLDGSELESLKQEVQVLYNLVVQLQIAVGEASNPELSNVFALRYCEQELLRIQELKVTIPKALEEMRLALRRKDLQRVSAYMGGMIGVVGTKD